MRELQSTVKRLDIILQSSSDSRETESGDEPATVPTEEYRRSSPDEESRAWQLGYKCFKSDDYAKGNSFLQLLDDIPQQLHKVAFEGWTAAMSDHAAFRKD